MPPLPQNPDAERSVLGAILLDNHALGRVSGVLQPDAFALPQHRQIFLTMLALSDVHGPIDLITLTEQLQRRDGLEAAGGVAYVSQLSDGLPRVSNVEYYAGIVTEKYRLRRLIHGAQQLQDLALAGKHPPEVLRRYARRGLEKLCPAATGPGDFQISLASADEFLSRSTVDERPFLAEGLLPACSQTIWQGRPKVGKSHTLLQVSFDLASGLPVFGHFPVRRAIRVVYVELEEPEAITKARYAAMLRAYAGEGPDRENLRFFSREDIHRMRVLPHELLGSHRKDFISALRDAGSEFVILVALRRFLKTGENLKDSDVAERINDALDEVFCETSAAIALANHNRKEEAATVEAQGFGSTFVSARADGTFDLARAAGGLRSVRSEARFEAPEQFFLRKAAVGDGELIRLAEAPPDPKNAQHEELLRRTAVGESLRKAAEALGISHTTAGRWVAESKKES